MVRFLTFLFFILPLTSKSQQGKVFKETKDYYIDNYSGLDNIEGLWFVEYTILDNVLIDNYGAVKSEYPPLRFDFFIAINQKENLFKGYFYDITKDIFNPKQEGFFSWLNFIRDEESKGYKYELWEKGVFHSGNFIWLDSKTTYFTYTETKRISDWHSSKMVISYRLKKITPSYFENPSTKVENNAERKNLFSGTGFAVSTSGYVLTNYHVVEKGNFIKVKGINGDFSQSFSASLEEIDADNDLALLKIINMPPNTIAKIPYIVNQKISEVGNDIFVLGYPLRSSMGDEIKLTSGIISSNSGYGGSTNSYQISAAVQPGNSGAPLFDSNGNIIGIINSKNTEAENAGYAIKSGHIMPILKLIPDWKNTTANISLKEASLPSKVKILKKYVYIVECFE